MNIRKQPRKGMVIAIMVVVLAMMNVLVLGVVTSGTTSTSADIARLESVRAIFAADAGAMVAMRQATLGRPCPANGTIVTLPGGGRVVWVSSPASGASGTVRIDGTNANAVRRVSVAYTIN